MAKTRTKKAKTAKSGAAAFFLLSLTALSTAASAYVPPLTRENHARPDFASMNWPTPAMDSPPGRFDISDASHTVRFAALSKESIPPPELKTKPPPAQKKATPVNMPEPKKKGDVTLKGYRYIKLRSMSSTGNSAQFLSMSGLAYKGAKIEQGTDLTLDAKASKKISLSGSFQELPQQDRQMMFKLGSGNYNLSFGDLVANFKGGEFSPFSKKITGIEFKYETKNSFGQIISSQSKSQTHTQTFTGRNIKGPYDLGANDLITESVLVKLNNQPLPASSYLLDAFQGEITFYEIIGQGDTVTVTYEQRLRGALNDGNVIGFSMGRSGKNWSAGYSRLTQQANTSAESARKSVSGEAGTLSGNTLSVSNKFIVRTRDTGSETIARITGAGTTDLLADVDYNAGLTEAERMTNYRNGQFTLTNPDPAARYEVSYSYYSEDNSAIQFQRKEFLSPLGSAATLQKQTVYYGSEEISVCYDASLDTVRLTLRRGIDYDIDEPQNRIILKNYQSEPFLRADYWYYPAADVSSTKYDHAVEDFTVKYSPIKTLSLAAETATSKSDLSSKPIQVLGEAVTTAPGTLNCETGIIRSHCTFPLAHKNVVRGTQHVYYNDSITPGNILPDYSAYMLDAAKGTIEIKVTIPAGTAIYADYQYLPDRTPGLATGGVRQIQAEYKGKGTTASFLTKSADTAFTPVGGENNMETAKTSWTIAHTFSPALDFSADGLNSDTALDLEATHKITSSAKSFRVKWTPDFLLKGLKLNTGWSSRNTSDDYSPRSVDTSDREFKLDGGAPMPFLKNANIVFGFANRKNESNAGSLAGSDTKQRSFGFDWKPSKTLTFKINKGSSAVSTRSASDTLTTTNTTDNININWLPLKLLTFGATIDRQSNKDSRPNSEGSQINKNMIRLDTKPFWKFNFISVVKTQDDHPSVNTPSTHSDTLSIGSSIKLTPSISLAPSFNTMKAEFGTDSGSTSDNTAYALEYRPPGRTYHFTYTTESGKLSSFGSSVFSSSRVKRDKYEIGYNPSPVWGYSAHTENEKSSSTGGSGDTSTTRNINLRVKHVPGANTAHWFIYNKNDRSGGQGNSFATIELGLDHKLTDLFRWDLLFRRSIFSDKVTQPNSFSGNLIESSLRVEF